VGDGFGGTFEALGVQAERSTAATTSSHRISAIKRRRS
jgi:hypothetical protein